MTQICAVFDTFSKQVKLFFCSIGCIHVSQPLLVGLVNSGLILSFLGFVHHGNTTVQMFYISTLKYKDFDPYYLELFKVVTWCHAIFTGAEHLTFNPPFVYDFSTKHVILLEADLIIISCSVVVQSFESNLDCKNTYLTLKKYSWILTALYYDINQKILRKKKIISKLSVNSDFSFVFKLCMIMCIGPAP